MHCKDTIYKVVTQGVIILGVIHKHIPGGIVLKDVVNTFKIPDNPGIFKLRKSPEMTHICGTFMYSRIDESDPFYAPYKKETTGIEISRIIPSTNIKRNVN